MPNINCNEVMKLNQKILDLWVSINKEDSYLEEYDKQKDKETMKLIRSRTPYLYGTEYRENCVLLVSMNYSTSWEKGYDDRDGLKWDNGYDLKHPSIVKLIAHHSKALNEIPTDLCSKIIPDIVIDHNDICHIDMFWMRHTSEGDLKPLLAKGDSPTGFALMQLDVFQQMIELIKPKVIVGIDAFVSESLMRLMKVEEIQPYYQNNEWRIGDHCCPVVLGGMVFGSRAMDRWSQSRMKAIITQLLQEGSYYQGL